jgi:NAD-dependent dihydropyrimidine dehydrogenase PreA subunit
MYNYRSLMIEKSILFCRCKGERIGSDRLQKIEDFLKLQNSETIIVSDLCLMVVVGRETLNESLEKGKEYLVIGCNERSMKLLFAFAHLDDSSFRFLNFLEKKDDEIFREISSYSSGSLKPYTEEVLSVSSGWISWFPVIDYSRCSGCGQCADFCLFGVYEKRGDFIKVSNPADCKNNCPACARICPQTAIIFPKYKDGGAIGGSDDIDEIAEQKRQSDDIKTLLEGNIYSALEMRKAKRQSIIRSGEMKKAIDERDNALNKK